MDNKDFFEVTCPECNEKIFAAKKQEFWYCGYCGKKIKLSLTIGERFCQKKKI